MSYLNVKTIKQSKSGYSVLVAPSNIRPIAYRWMNYAALHKYKNEKNLYNLFNLIHQGEFHLQAPKNKLMRDVLSTYQSVCHVAKNNSLGWRYSESVRSLSGVDAVDRWDKINLEDKHLVNSMVDHYFVL